MCFKIVLQDPDGYIVFFSFIDESLVGMSSLTTPSITSSVFMPQNSNDLSVSATSVIPWHENSPPPPPDDIPEDNEILDEINTPNFLNEDPIFISNHSTTVPLDADFSISSLNLRSITPTKNEDIKIGKYIF